MQHVHVCAIFAYLTKLNSQKLHDMTYLYNGIEYLHKFTNIYPKEFKDILVIIVDEFSEIFGRIFWFSDYENFWKIDITVTTRECAV